jgi:hypothetical protein
MWKKHNKKERRQAYADDCDACARGKKNGKEKLQSAMYMVAHIYNARTATPTAPIRAAL